MPGTGRFRHRRRAQDARIRRARIRQRRARIPSRRIGRRRLRRLTLRQNDPTSGMPGEMDCAREAIHLSGAIQPHGYLLSCTLPDWTVRQASANVADLLDMPATEVIGRSLREHVADDVLEPLLEAIDLLEPGASPQRAAIGNIGTLAHLC